MHLLAERPQAVPEQRVQMLEASGGAYAGEPSLEDPDVGAVASSVIQQFVYDWAELPPMTNQMTMVQNDGTIEDDAVCRSMGETFVHADHCDYACLTGRFGDACDLGSWYIDRFGDEVDPVLRPGPPNITRMLACVVVENVWYPVRIHGYERFREDDKLSARGGCITYEVANLIGGRRLIQVDGAGLDRRGGEHAGVISFLLGTHRAKAAMRAW